MADEAKDQGHTNNTAAAAASTRSTDGIRKLFGDDYKQEWGDGGGATISYPVWFSGRLITVPEETRLAVSRLLRAMDRFQNDIQPNTIVHDIIDPSLHARIVGEDELQKLIEERKEADIDESFRKSDEEVQDAVEEGYESDYGSQAEIQEATEEAHKESLRLRGSFQWVPIVVTCLFDESTKKRRAQFHGHIPGLPERTPAFENLYAGLEDIFSAMLPLLAKLDLSRGHLAPHAALQNGQLQVVIKTQEYVLPPHSSYTGRWHTEGFSENICAAGVYYMDVSAQTTGGSLSFRPPESPDADYFEYLTEDDQVQVEEEEGRGPPYWQHYVKDVEVQTGTAVAFQNSIPHRFRTIRNDTDEPQRRLFVNFFIVDPDKPLQETTSNTAGPYSVRRALARKGLDTKELQMYVLGFMSSHASGGMLNRKLLRDQARAAMSKDRPHWYTYMFGNSGDLMYHGDNRLKDSETRHRIGNYEHSACPTSELGSGM